MKANKLKPWIYSTSESFDEYRKRYYAYPYQYLTYDDIREQVVSVLNCDIEEMQYSLENLVKAWKISISEIEKINSDNMTQDALFGYLIERAMRAAKRIPNDGPGYLMRWPEHFDRDGLAHNCHNQVSNPYWYYRELATLVLEHYQEERGDEKACDRAKFSTGCDDFYDGLGTLYCGCNHNYIMLFDNGIFGRGPFKYTFHVEGAGKFLALNNES